MAIRCRDALQRHSLLQTANDLADADDLIVYFPPTSPGIGALEEGVLSMKKAYVAETRTTCIGNLPIETVVGVTGDVTCDLRDPGTASGHHRGDGVAHRGVADQCDWGTTVVAHVVRCTVDPQGRTLIGSIKDLILPNTTSVTLYIHPARVFDRDRQGAIDRTSTNALFCRKGRHHTEE